MFQNASFTTARICMNQDAACRLLLHLEKSTPRATSSTVCCSPNSLNPNIT